MILCHAFDDSEPLALLMPLLGAAILVLAYLLFSYSKRSGHVAYKTVLDRYWQIQQGWALAIFS